MAANAPLGEASWVDVDGIRTRYFDQGEGDAVVLVGGGHFGSPYGAADWDLNVAALANDFRVIALDKLGQGHTDNPARPEDYLIGSAVAHLRSFVRAIGIDSAHFVGHSRGGYAVCRLAMEVPEVVRSLVVIDCGTLMHQRSAFYPVLAAQMADIDDLRERYEFSIREQSFDGSMETEYWLDDILGFVTSEKCCEAVRIAGECEGQFSEDLVVSQRETREWIAAGGLGDTPVLVVWAYNDRGAPFEECGIPALHLFLRGVPDARMHVFNRSGHFPFREWPDEFNALVRLFLSGPAASAASRS